MRCCDCVTITCWAALAAVAYGKMDLQKLDHRYFSSWALQPHQLPTTSQLLHRRQATPLPGRLSTPAKDATSSAAFISGSGLSVATFAAANESDTWPIQDPTEDDPDWTFPTPFDSAGITFSTGTCPAFFNSFLDSDEFQECSPLSMLFGTSSGFFQAQANATTVLPYVLDQACQAPSRCQERMAHFAKHMKKDDVCGQDLDDDNDIAKTALNGFLSYKMMQKAGCLKSTDTGNYCFAQAAADVDDPSLVSWWYLFTGSALSSTTQPACDECTQQLMEVYSQQAKNENLQISETYESAQVLANDQCGEDYAPEASSAGSSRARGLLVFTLLVLLGFRNFPLL